MARWETGSGLFHCFSGSSLCDADPPWTLFAEPRPCDLDPRLVGYSRVATPGDQAVCVPIKPNIHAYVHVYIHILQFFFRA